MRVLAADDEPDMRLLLELALGMEPDIVLTLVSSGDEAIAHAASGMYDVILLDGLMPGLGGAATCRHLRDDPRLAKVPIVFLTALTSAGTRAELEAAGGSAVIAKPFDPFTLAATLRGIVRP